MISLFLARRSSSSFSIKSISSISRPSFSSSTFNSILKSKNSATLIRREIVLHRNFSTIIPLQNANNPQDKTSTHQSQSASYFHFFNWNGKDQQQAIWMKEKSEDEKFHEKMESAHHKDTIPVSWILLSSVSLITFLASVKLLLDLDKISPDKIKTEETQLKKLKTYASFATIAIFPSISSHNFLISRGFVDKLIEMSVDDRDPKNKIQAIKILCNITDNGVITDYIVKRCKKDPRFYEAIFNQVGQKSILDTIEALMLLKNLIKNEKFRDELAANRKWLNRLVDRSALKLSLEVVTGDKKMVYNSTYCSELVTHIYARLMKYQSSQKILQADKEFHNKDVKIFQKYLSAGGELGANVATILNPPAIPNSLLNQISDEIQAAFPLVLWAGSWGLIRGAWPMRTNLISNFTNPKRLMVPLRIARNTIFVALGVNFSTTILGKLLTWKLPWSDSRNELIALQGAETGLNIGVWYMLTRVPSYWIIPLLGYHLSYAADYMWGQVSLVDSKKEEPKK